MLCSDLRRQRTEMRARDAPKSATSSHPKNLASAGNGGIGPPGAVHQGCHRHLAVPGKAHLIAVDEKGMQLADVACVDLSAAQRAVRVHARHAVVDENKPCSGPG